MMGINVFGKELTDEEINRNVHRMIVGGKWEKFGQLQHDFLISNGLKPFHKLLDIGCGALRGGMSCIKYLNAGNYYGFDVNESLLKAGMIEINKAGLDDKKPHLLVGNSFQIDKFNTQFDYMISVSLFTHLPMNNIIRCLHAARSNLKSGGIYFSSFWEAPAPVYLYNINFPEGVITQYDVAPYHYSFEELEWMAASSGLKVAMIGNWGHPKNQQMVSFHHKVDKNDNIEKVHNEQKK